MASRITEQRARDRERFRVRSVIFGVSSPWHEWAGAVAGDAARRSHELDGFNLLLSTAPHCKRLRLTSVGLVTGLLLAGCAHTVNLLNPDSPKFEGSYASAAATPEPSRLRV